MTLLLDTNALLWLLDGKAELGPKARARIAGATKIWVSDISLLEIAIKAARRKLEVPPRLGSLVEKLGIERAGVHDEYLDRIRELPPHHRDPFDRYLIAQALVDGVPIVTSDPVFALYGVQVVDARS